MKTFMTNFGFFVRQSSALIGYVGISYMWGLAVMVGLPLGFVVLQVLASGTLGTAGGAIYSLVFIVGTLTVGLYLSIPVLWSSPHLLSFCKRHYQSPFGLDSIAPFLVTATFVTSSYWRGLHPAASQVSWLTYLQSPQIWAYSGYVLVRSVVASVSFYFLTKRSTGS